MLSPTMHGEMMREIRWNRDEVLATRDGLDLATLELSASDMAALRLIASWPLMKTVGALGAGRGCRSPGSQGSRAKRGDRTPVHA